MDNKKILVSNIIIDIVRNLELSHKEIKLLFLILEQLSGQHVL